MNTLNDTLFDQQVDTANVARRSGNLFNRDSTFDTLPHPAPFDQSGLRYASPPVEWDQQRVDGVNVFSPTSSFSFAVGKAGSTINKAFPQAARIASQQLVVASALLSASLSYAITNATFSGPIGLYVLIDNRPIISVSGNSDLLIAAITPQGAAASAWSDVRSVSFSLDVAPLIQANQSVSLYASCANQAADFVWGVVTFKYVVL